MWAARFYAPLQMGIESSRAAAKDGVWLSTKDKRVTLIIQVATTFLGLGICCSQA
jgi:lipoate-protein ligase B